MSLTLFVALAATLVSRNAALVVLLFSEIAIAAKVPTTHSLLVAAVSWAFTGIGLCAWLWVRSRRQAANNCEDVVNKCSTQRQTTLAVFTTALVLICDRFSNYAQWMKVRLPSTPGQTKK
jgi:hypothetical protein